MSTVLLRNPLAPDEIRSLRNEFPQFAIKLAREPLSADNWSDVEVLYSNTLEANELEQAHRLRWIHIPSAQHEGLCLDKIQATTNLLITDTKDPDVHQVAEFALGALLACAKDLFYWHEKGEEAGALWQSPHRDLIWEAQGKTLLQIGLGRLGSAIADYAARLGIRVWGIAGHKTFHPYCHKVFGGGELNAVLPNADIISFAPPISGENPILGLDQFKLIKEGAILLLLGLKGIDAKALTDTVKRGKFRHVMIDTPTPLPPKSPLWQDKTTTITPGIATSPETESRLEFHQFRYNFRRYLHADFDRMKNHV